MDNKIIKEMAKDISEHLHGVFRIEIDTLAEALVNAGYRKIDEDAVVLTRERYSVLTEIECKK